MAPRKRRASGAPTPASSALSAHDASMHSFPPSPTSSSQFYGFVIYLGSIVIFGLYALWAFLDDRILGTVVGWYPNREWALLAPAWITMAIVFVYLSYASLNIYSTPSLNSLAHVVDTQGHIHLKGQHPIIKNSRHRLQEGGVAALYDLPLGLVNAVLYREEGDP